MNKDEQKHIEKVIEIATEITNNTKKDSSSFHTRLGSLINNNSGKTFLIRLMDTAFRSSNNTRVSLYIRRLISTSSNGTSFFTSFEQLLVNLFMYIGHYTPFISLPLILSRIKAITSQAVLPAYSQKMKNHLRQNKNKNIQSNINLIGEALLGEEEADERIKAYKELLADKNVSYISIKISTIYSQINTLAYEHTLENLITRLSSLFDYVLQLEKEQGIQKFINLDMEEYKDLSLTVDTFTQTLAMPQYKNIRAGIVLQAYLPDSIHFLTQLQVWAKNRIETGGSAVKVRIVKGANLEMEKTDASLHNWVQAPYHTKHETDANYIKMVQQGLCENYIKGLNIGVASHNIFDLSNVILIAKAKKINGFVDIEMLEGICGNLPTTIQQHGFNLLLYTPIVPNEKFINAIAYLVRRLDESTAKGNFIKEGFNLTVNSKKWFELSQCFQKAYEFSTEVNTIPQRTQDRNQETASVNTYKFENEPDTDFTLRKNQAWALAIKNKWQNNPSYIIPHDFITNTKEHKGWNNKTFTYPQATNQDIEKCIAMVQKSEWSNDNFEERHNTLHNVAKELQKARANLIGICVEEVGKTIPEIDVEISEAIDFAMYYTFSAKDWISLPNHTATGKGITLVISPWNFPIAIPAGGIIAAIASGNNVILKPANNAIASAYALCECFWQAGIPKSALQFLPCASSILNPYLQLNSIFQNVVLTGGTDTAKKLLTQNPTLPLSAETGGKNTTIVTAMADRELAISHIIASAFGNTGQKCSATSLLILEEEVYHDKAFKKALKDAILSKSIGSPWEFQHEIGPLAQPVSQAVLTSIETLSKKEEWLIKPTVSENTHFISPGVKWGINTESYEYQTELFAPILAVMCASDLTHAIEIANGTTYGLTAGLESLDNQEINFWTKHIEAGNLYINRPTTGAIVQRQPFGGIKKSSFGAGLKAGGANYVSQFMNFVFDGKTDFTPQNTPQLNLSSIEYLQLQHIIQSFKQAYKKILVQTDLSKIRGERNITRMIHPKKILLVITEEDSTFETTLRIATATLLKTKLNLVLINDSPFIDDIKKLCETYQLPLNFVSKQTELIEHLCPLTTLRFGHESTISPALLEYTNNEAIHVFNNRVQMSGKLEILNYLTAQHISHRFHRYGNLLDD